MRRGRGEKKQASKERDLHNPGRRREESRVRCCKMALGEIGDFGETSAKAKSKGTYLDINRKSECFVHDWHRTARIYS